MSAFFYEILQSLWHMAVRSVRVFDKYKWECIVQFVFAARECECALSRSR